MSDIIDQYFNTPIGGIIIIMTVCLVFYGAIFILRTGIVAVIFRELFSLAAILAAAAILIGLGLLVLYGSYLGYHLVLGL